MLTMRSWSVMAAGAAVMGLGATLAFAAADDAIKGRQGCMKAHGATFGVISPIMKGEKPYDAAAIQAAFAAEDAACADWDKWWGEDTMKGETVETWAKPEIWSDMEGFKAAGGKWYEAATAVRNAADEAAFKAAVPAMGEACGACHEKFRRPKS